MTPEATTQFKFEDHYRLQGKLSNGSFGVVHIAQHKLSGRDFAVKVIQRNKLSEKEKSSVIREVNILKDCRTIPHVVQLVDFYTSPEHFYVVQMYAKGGDVFERLAHRTSYTECDARNLARHLLLAVLGFHERKLAHRDLKPENLLLVDVLDDARIMVADFGFASYVPEDGSGLKTRCGTPAFVGPEVLVPTPHYDERVDLWSCGCLLYMLLAGYPPFQDSTHKGLFRKIRGGDFVFHDTYWKNVSIPAKQVISGLLTVDPNYRTSAQTALQSRWLQMDEDLLKGHDLTASLGEIKKFHTRRSLKGAFNAVMWTVTGKLKSAGDVERLSSSGSNDNIGPGNYRRNNSDGGISSWSEFDSDNDDEKNGDNDTDDGSSVLAYDYTLAKEASDSVLLGARPTFSFQDMYDLGDLLHSSPTVKVHECIHKITKQVFAVKIIDRKGKSRKSVTGKTMAEMVLHEVAILDSLKHDNIIRINEFFEDNESFFLVMERLRGGDAFDRIVQAKRYTEEDTRKIAKILLQAVAYLHQQGIVHRDLKPQNLLLRSPEASSFDFTIIGFGFACRVRKPQSLTTRCGTPSYVAPEVLKNVPYDQAIDMWSIGVILYVMLCGHPPFVDENQSELFRKIRMGEWKFHGEVWETNVSNDAKDIIKRLLATNPLQRMTAKQALQHSWICNGEEVINEKTSKELSKSDTRSPNRRETLMKKRSSRLRISVRNLTMIQPQQRETSKAERRLGAASVEKEMLVSDTSKKTSAIKEKLSTSTPSQATPPSQPQKQVINVVNESFQHVIEDTIQKSDQEPNSSVSSSSQKLKDASSSKRRILRPPPDPSRLLEI
jgi:serine/threonine protein kinase